MVDIIIKNGKVVFPDRTIETAIAVDDGKIVAIGSSTRMPRGEKIIDARGKFVLPGGIDPHVHIGISGIEDFFVATKATSRGGTTTIIDFARGGLKGVQQRRAEADGKVVIDYALHPILGNIIPEKPEIIDELKKLIDYGTPSFKLFMVYANPVDDNTILKVLEVCKAHGGLLCLHAENNAMIEYNRAEAVEKGEKEAIFHALTRPPITEAEAVNMALFLSTYLKAPYMNMHLSIKEGVDMLRDARKKGNSVYGETCTHYLCRTEEDLRGPRGFYFICTPPLRTKEHIDGLWKGLADGTLSVVSSDHCAYTTEMKERGGGSFDKTPNGLPGHEFRLPILFSEGVVKGHISVNRLSEIFSTNAAKIYGLYPKKGVINIGSDADLVVLDPKLEKKITTEESLYNMDWYPYERMEVKGWPITTILKGKVIWEDGEFQGKQGEGEFLKRKLAPELSKGPIA